MGTCWPVGRTMAATTKCTMSSVSPPVFLGIPQGHIPLQSAGQVTELWPKEFGQRDEYP